MQVKIGIMKEDRKLIVSSPIMNFSFLVSDKYIHIYSVVKV